MIDIVERLRFDAARCEVSFSKGIARNIEEGIAEIERLREAAARVCLFDWSGNDDDAVAAIEQLRRTLEEPTR